MSSKNQDTKVGTLNFRVSRRSGTTSLLKEKSESRPHLKELSPVTSETNVQVKKSEGAKKATVKVQPAPRTERDGYDRRSESGSNLLIEQRSLRTEASVIQKSSTVLVHRSDREEGEKADVEVVTKTKTVRSSEVRVAEATKKNNVEEVSTRTERIKTTTKNQTTLEGTNAKTPAKKSSKPRKKKAVVDPNQQSLFDLGIRRTSGRKTQSEIKKEETDLLEKQILSQDESHLEVYEDEVKGKGLRVNKSMTRGEFICEYSGDLVDTAEAKRRDDIYSGRPEKYGSYMYHFKMNNQRYCVDATVAGRFGRLINHSAKSANVFTRALMVDTTPRLCFFALRDIKVGEELQYDYGDRRKEIIRSMPWLQE
eukprot:CFRG1842T1